VVVSGAGEFRLLFEMFYKKIVFGAHRVTCTGLFAGGSKAGLFFVVGGSGLVKTFGIENFIDVDFLHSITAHAKAVLLGLGERATLVVD